MKIDWHVIESNIASLYEEIKSNLFIIMDQDLIHKCWPKFLCLYKPHAHKQKRTRERHRKNSAETATPLCKKPWKSVRLKTTLEANSIQKNNIALLPATSWSETNQKPSLSMPITHCKPPWTLLCTWDRNSFFMHLCAKFLAYLY